MPDCEKCGQVHATIRGSKTVTACTGHISSGERAGEPCRNTPRKGQRVCGFHGGKARQVQAAAERRRQRAEAEALMVTLGGPIPGDPAEIVAERIAARNGHVRWLLDRVRQLEPEALTWGLTKRKTAIDRGHDEDGKDGKKRRSFAGTDEGDTLEAKPHIWYALYLESADKLERLCIEAMRVGLDERRVRLAEKQGDLLVRVLDGLLGELGHNPNDPATAEIVARHLELVA